MNPCPQCGQPFAASDSCASCGYQPGAPISEMIAPDPFLGKTLDGFYIRSPLGEGGFARVYLCDQLSAHRRAVLKILKPQLADNAQVVERFGREAQLASRLSHPAIPQIYAVGVTEDGLPYFAMEYIAGRSLAKIINSEGALEIKRAVRLICLLADAVDVAHDGGVIHRDLKPENIMVVSRNLLPGDPPYANEGVRILDFGIAKEEGSNDQGLTKSGEVLGTPHYMSPEQANGEKVDRGTDLYSLGVVAFEMLTGKVPFTGISPGAILLQHISLPPPRLEDLAQRKFPSLVEAVLARALSKHPNQRHNSAREFAAALAGAIGIPVPFKMPEAPLLPSLSQSDPLRRAVQPPEPPARSRLTALGIALFGVGLLGLGWIFLGSNEPPSADSASSVPATSPASESLPAEPTPPAPKPATKPGPNAGAALPDGASLAGTAPLPAKRRGLPPPDTRLAALITAGDFLMGNGVRVTLDGFYLDAYEVTVEEYAACVAANRCNPAQEFLGFRDPKMPVVGVSFDDARNFCAWEKKRLPTEAEWEKAARGVESRLYPWGSEISCDRANYGGAVGVKECSGKNPARVAEVGSYPDGVSPFGAYDLAGNVWEWTLDAFEKGYTPSDGAKNPTGPESAISSLRVIRGGGWRDGAAGVTALARQGLAPETRNAEVGFRCVREQ